MTMKKTYILFLVLFSFTSYIVAQNTSPQTPLNGSRSGKKNSTTAITRSLGAELKLDPGQETRMNKAISSFMAQKKKANAQDAEQRPRFLQAVFDDFHRDIKTFLTDNQYSTFLSLKPKENDPGNPLAPLYY